MTYPDKQRILELDALEVAEDLGLVWTGKPARRSSFNGDEYRAFMGSNKPYLSFKSDGRYYDLKRGRGGTVLRLMAQAKDPDHDVFALERVESKEIYMELAARYNLWAVGEREVSRSRQIANTDRSENAGAWLHRRIKNLPYNEDWCTLCAHLGIERPTVKAIIDGKFDDPDAQANLGIQPAAPSRPLQAAIWNGWGVADTTEHFQGKYWVLDIDANTNDEWASTEDICDLADTLPAAALVLSSLSDDATSAKGHIWFAAEDSAKNPAQWEEVWEILREKCPENMRDHIDPASGRFTQVLRLPGEPKRNGDHGAVLIWTREKKIHVKTMLECRGVERVWKGKGDAMFTVNLGKSCTFVKEDSSGAKTDHFMAAEIWPLYRYVTTDKTERGLFLRLHDMDGRVQYATVSAGELVDKAKRTRAASRLANLGARLMPDQEERFMRQLASVYARGIVQREATLLDRPGWYGQSYMMQHGVIEHQGKVLVCESAKFPKRCHLEGTLAQWRDEVAARCTTPVLKAAVLTSLAGALVRRVRQHPFIVHFVGASSTGKSTACYVSASVWGPGDDKAEEGLFSTWLTTTNYLEKLAEDANDACISLDEIALFQDVARGLSQAIHTLGGTSGKGRLKQGAQADRQRRWYCTTVSTGEKGIAELMGEGLQGGHLVRALDVRLELGECTESAQHKEELHHACTRFYGSAARAWVSLLESYSDDQLRAALEKRLDQLCEYHDATDGETKRVLRILAILRGCGSLAASAGIVPWSEQELDAMTSFLIERVVVQRREEGISDPRVRVLRNFMLLIDTDSDAAPFVTVGYGGEKVGKRKGLMALREENGEQNLVHTQAAWLTQLMGQGIKSLDWLRWCQEEGLVASHKLRRIAGIRGRFWTIDVDRVIAMIGDRSEAPPVTQSHSVSLHDVTEERRMFTG